jgi:hypothetical protein
MQDLAANAAALFATPSGMLESDRWPVDRRSTRNLRNDELKTPTRRG